MKSADKAAARSKGRPSNYYDCDTKVIRVPKRIAEDVLRFARWLDHEKMVEKTEEGGAQS